MIALRTFAAGPIPCLDISRNALLRLSVTISGAFPQGGRCFEINNLTSGQKYPVFRSWITQTGSDLAMPKTSKINLKQPMQNNS